MFRLLKSTFMVVAAILWLGAAMLIGLLLFQYLGGGAGLQIFGFLLPVSSTTGLIGLAHFIGLSAAACLCLAIGAGLFARAIVPAEEGHDQASVRREIDNV